MANTDTDIGNMALAHIGYSSSQIDDLDEDSPEAVEIKFWFPRKLGELLEMWPWEVAQKWETLTLVEENPNEDYLFSYRYPPDCVFAGALYVANTVGTIISEGELPYVTAEDAQGKLILTNQAQAGLKYTGRRNSTAYWSEAFCSALAWFIAADIALPLSKDVTYQTNAAQQFNEANKQAQVNSINETTDEPPAQSSGMKARNGQVGLYNARDVWYEG